MRKLFLILAGTFLIALFVLSGHFCIMDACQTIHSGPTPSLSKVEVGQTFVCSYDNLCRVDVFLATPGARHRGRINFHLRKNLGDDADLRSVSVEASKIKDNHYCSFAFAPIKASKGRSFYFFLDSSDLTPPDVYVWFYSSEKAYRRGRGFLDGRPLGGDLQFNTHCKVGFLKGTGIALSRIARGKPFVFGSTLFYPILFIVYGGLLLLLMCTFFAKPRS
ncbi:MAG: hypothetical protein QMD08_04650 [Actinomycetota bacterium]|nr:hypothetical protein [Actinomycetota bacterium]